MKTSAKTSASVPPAAAVPPGDEILAAAELFLRTPNWIAQLNDVLGRWGRAFGFGRVYLVQNTRSTADRLHMTRCGEWTDESVALPAARQIGNPGVQQLSYADAGLARWEQILPAGELVAGAVPDLPKPERHFLSAQGVRVVVAVPVFSGAAWWGFLGFDDLRGDRPPAGDGLAPLRAAARIVGAAIEREHADAELRRLVQVLDQTADVILVTDPQGAIQYVNPAFEQVTGYTRAEVLGQNPRLLKSGQHRGVFYRELWDTIRRGESWHGRFINRRKSGALYREEATISPVRDREGRIVNFVATKRDITREVEFEEQLRQAQKMEAMGMLAGGVAHDFNNALTPIMAYAELTLLEMEPGDARRDYLVQIQSCAERASGLTRQLLVFSRKREPDMMIVNLNDVIGGLQKMLHRLIREDIEIVFTLEPQLGLVRADPAQIEQILLNLTVNARDAMPQGGRLRISTAVVDLDEDFAAQHPDAPTGRCARLEVSDTGSGMAPDVIARIFEPFFTTKQAGEGTGLGLTTVFGIVKQHHGAITVESEPGHGSVFAVYLPRAPEAVDAKDATRLVPPDDGGTETVMIVEDDGNVRTLAGAILGKKGYRVLEFGDSREALQFARQSPQPIDLLLADIVMPHLNGCDLFQRLSVERPTLRALFMSGYSRQLMRRYGLHEGAPNFLQKPFSMASLARKVREALSPAAPAAPAAAGKE